MFHPKLSVDLIIHVAFTWYPFWLFKSKRVINYSTDCHQFKWELSSIKHDRSGDPVFSVEMKWSHALLWMQADFFREANPLFSVLFETVWVTTEILSAFISAWPSLCSAAENCSFFPTQMHCTISCSITTTDSPHIMHWNSPSALFCMWANFWD